MMSVSNHPYHLVSLYNDRIIDDIIHIRWELGSYLLTLCVTLDLTFV